MEGQVFTSYPFSGCHWDPDIIFEVRSPAAHVCSLGVPLPLWRFGEKTAGSRFSVANSSGE